MPAAPSVGYFDEVHPGACGNCDNCLNPPETIDATEAARKALSAVYRTGQRYGQAYVIAVLHGRDDEPRIHANEHHRLSVFGLGQDMSAEAWKGLLRQLIAEGYLRVDTEAYNTLKLTPKCRPLLRGEETFRARAARAKPARAERSRARGGEARAKLSERDRQLFDALRGLRSSLAKERSVPPYVVCHDRALIEIAEKKPRTHGALHQISGFGDKKVEDYGAAILDLIEDFGG